LQVEENKDLFAGSLFRFQYVPGIEAWQNMTSEINEKTNIKFISIATINLCIILDILM